jgi:hypothetical protein
MAWKYPYHLIKSDYVVDNIAVDENFLSVVEETSGYLNEHNFKVNEVTPLIQRKDAPEGYSMKLFRSRPSSSPSPLGKTTAARSSLSIADINWVQIPNTDGYETKASYGISMEFTSRGGPTWICASFNLHMHPLPRPAVLDPEASEYTSVVNPDGGFGCNCALELDGNIINESLVGSGDPTSEYYKEKAYEVANPDAGEPIKIKPRGGGGINGSINSVVLDAVIDLPPGRHTIRVAIDDIRASNTGNGPYISNREIFALELTR